MNPEPFIKRHLPAALDRVCSDIRRGAIQTEQQAQARLVVEAQAHWMKSDPTTCHAFVDRLQAQALAADSGQEIQ